MIRRRSRLLMTLQLEFLLALVISGILPLGAAGALLIVLDQQSLATQSARELTGLARGLSVEMELYVDGRLQDLRLIGSLPDIASMDPEKQEAMLETLFLVYTDFADLGVFDLSGTLLAGAQPKLEGLVATGSAFQSAATRGEQAWEIGPAPRNGNRSLLIYVPIRDAKRQVVAVAGGVVDLANLVGVINQMPVGNGGRAFVVDNAGNALLHPDADVMQHPQKFIWPVLATGAPQAGPGTFSYTWRNVSQIASYAPIPNLGWTVVVEQPENEVLVPARRAGMIGAGALILSVVLALGAAYLTVRQLTRPLQQLATAARAFGAGDPDTPLPHAHSGSEEVAVLVSAFEDMRTAVSQSLQRERAERALSGAILSGVPIGLLVLTKNQQVLSANPRAAEILDLAPERLAGATPSEIWPDSELRQHVESALHNDLAQYHFVIEQSNPVRLFRFFLNKINTDQAQDDARLLLGIEDLTELIQIKLRFQAMEVLHTINQKLLSSSDFDATLQEIVNLAVHLGSFDLGVIWLLPVEGTKLQPAACYGVRAAMELLQEDTMAHAINALVGGQQTRVIERYQPEFAHNLHIQHEDLTSIVVVSIQTNEQVLGSIELGCRKSRLFSTAELDLLTAIGSQVGLAIQKARLDEALRKSEAEARLLSLVASRTDNAVIIADQSARIEWVNDGFTRITGYTLDEVRGRRPGVFLQGPESDPATVEYMRSRILKGEGFKTEVINYHKSGRPYWISIETQPLHDAEGRLVKFMALESDITEHKRIEQELQFQKAVLEAQNESAIDGMLVVSAERQWLSFNHRFLEMWDFDPASLPQLSASALEWMRKQVVEGDAFVTRIEELYQHPTERNMEEVQLLDGRVLERYTAPVTGPDEAYYGRVWFYRDISDRKHVEEMLRIAKDDAEKANRAKSEFLSRMSHELRTPLHAILGFAQILEMEELPTQQHTGVTHILNAGRHLLKLINEVLDITRIEAGNLSFSPEPVQVLPEIQEAIDLVQPLADRRQIQIRQAVPMNFHTEYVKADRQRLKQVLVNLLSNAIKYNRSGGTVTVGCDLLDTAEIRLNVTDTGYGIASEQLERLFIPFERLDAVQRGVEGTGLGLSLSKRLIEMMGGQIGIESIVGQGSMFWIQLPRASSLTIQPDALPSDPVEERPQYTATLVYIEDNASNIVLVEHILKRHPGMRLLVSQQGGVGIEMVKAHRPELVLLDMNLPDMDGLAVLQELQADPVTHAIPVVVLSADATPSQIDRMLGQGARAYITKPLNIRQFTETIMGLLTGK